MIVAWMNSHGWVISARGKEQFGKELTGAEAYDTPLVQAEAMQAALDIASKYGGIDGSHHKEWVIDQMVRALIGDGYEAWVAAQRDGEDGPDTYEWPEGIAP